MDHDGIIADKVSIGAQFQSIDEVQNMIRHLQKLEEDMIKNNIHTNGSKGFSKSFEDLSVLEEKDYQIDDNETEWLTKVPGVKKISVKDLEADESFIDSGLLNVRFKLLNFIKSSIIEEKSSKFTNSPRCNQSSIGTYNRRKSPPLSATVCVSTASPPSLFHGSSPRTVVSGFAPYKSDSESSPVSSVVAKNSFEFLSPSYQPPISSNRLDVDTSNLYFSTPSGKPIDSRTYTRPKKSRLPLETYGDHMDLPVSPVRTVQHETTLTVLEPVDMETTSATKNMNETFVAEDEGTTQKVQSDLSPPRRVTRNLSYVIRRDSESPNNNSPVNASENIENIAVDLNNTFVRTREDTYSPSPTGSSNSIHTSSMEELHNLARLQEQSLRMSSNPKMLTRKETHTVVRVPDQPTLRPMNKPPTENQGQPKIRIQSRIPAPGAGSRIRPPVNGTRRPIASGGIRRAPEEWGGGAY